MTNTRTTVARILTPNGKEWEVTTLHPFGEFTISGKHYHDTLREAREMARRIINNRRLTTVKE